MSTSTSQFAELDLKGQLNELDGGGASAWNSFFMRLKNSTLEGAGERTSRLAVASLNRFKNRYQDVVPFDQARVVLAKENMYRNYERPESLFEKAEEAADRIARANDNLNDDAPPPPPPSPPAEDPKQLVERAKLFSDYINASPVKCPQAAREYILTQGPVASTSADFWEMVWEQRCTVIVMLNNLIEKGMVKCYPYYPSVDLLRGKRLHYLHDSRLYVIPTLDRTSPDVPLAEYYLPDLSLRVQLMSESECSSYTLRRLRLIHLPHSFLPAIPSRSSTSEDPASDQVLADLLADPQWESCGEIREVQHFHYRVWADFSVPPVPSFLNLLLAVRRTNVFADGTGGGIAIHCSAGIGRSGTFALVDSALRIVEQQRTLKAVNLPQLLLTLRSSRMGLVQTPDQLRFCYTAVLEGGRLILDALESADPDTPAEQVVNALDCEALLRQPTPNAQSVIGGGENNHHPVTSRPTHSDEEKPPRRSKPRPESPPVPSRSPPSIPHASNSVAPAPLDTSAAATSEAPLSETSARLRTAADGHDSRQEREERIRRQFDSMRRKQQELLQRTGFYWNVRRQGLALAELTSRVLPTPLPRPRSSALLVGSFAVLMLAVGLWLYLQ